MAVFIRVQRSPSLMDLSCTANPKVEMYLSLLGCICRISTRFRERWALIVFSLNNSFRIHHCFAFVPCTRCCIGVVYFKSLTIFCPEILSDHHCSSAIFCCCWSCWRVLRSSRQDLAAPSISPLSWDVLSKGSSWCPLYSESNQYPGNKIIINPALKTSTQIQVEPPEIEQRTWHALQPRQHNWNPVFIGRARAFLLRMFYVENIYPGVLVPGSFSRGFLQCLPGMNTKGHGK